MKRTIIGLDLDREYSQISFYSERNMEPVTVGNADDANRYLIPTPSDLFSVTEQAMELGVMTLANFLKSCVALTKTPDMQQIYMMVTMREIRQPWIDAVKNACEMMGMERDHVWLQTHRESFFYYTLNQKRDIWAQKSALFEYEDEKITSYVLEVDYGTKPALVTVTPGIELNLGHKGRRSEEEWNHYRDEKFLELIGETFAGDTFSSTFLVGDSFDKTWAVDSLSYLCRRRHVFQGRNLYTKGACYAAGKRMGVGNALLSYLYKSEDMLEYNLSMQMNMRGKVSNYLMVSAGGNWFDAEHSCEFLLEDTDEVVIFAKSMMGDPAASYTIPLKGLPARPGRTTRLQLKMAFTSAALCKVTIRDLGFGEFFPASGLVWESVLKLR